MIRDIIETEVNLLTKEFNEAFPNSYIFRKHENMITNLISCIVMLFNEQKIFSADEEEIHNRIVQSLNITEVKKVVKPEDINEHNSLVHHMKLMYAQWGDEIGTLLLKCNRTIANIAMKASNEFDEKIKVLST